MNFQIYDKKGFILVKFFLPVLILCFCVIGLTSVDAQTKRRKKTGIPQPVATPVSSLIIPEIIRRADENDVENPNIVVSQETQTVETSNDVETLKNRVKTLSSRIKTLESANKTDPDEKEKKLLMNLDILSRAEQRTEALQKQLYEVIEKENTVKARIEQIVFDMRPEMIDRNVAFAGSLRPEDVRNARTKSLESEKSNLESLLAQIQTNRAKLEQSVERADLLVEKIRFKFEKEIDEALDADEQLP